MSASAEFAVVAAKAGADQAFAPDSGVPVLTVDEAIAQAVANNISLRMADLDMRSAADNRSANRTRRFANTQTITSPIAVPDR